MPFSWKKILVGAAVLYVVILAGAILLLLAAPRLGLNPAVPAPKSGFTALIGQAKPDRAASGTLIPVWSPSLGAANAKITIVEFADFQCPFSRTAALPIREIVSLYPNDVRLVFRHFPLTAVNPLAQRLAESSQCAHDQGKFWAFHDQVYLTGNNEELQAADIDRIARSIGLNMEHFNKCVVSNQFADAVKQDFADGLNAGVRGTPTWFVNGQKVEGDLTRADWENVVKQVLKK
ncbi:MAG: thioredoxin domain-containing protein [Parcubacteria group bacterium]|nr:thioredoxin domain-containing protein [Parcubacteria group bacterium]